MGDWECGRKGEREVFLKHVFSFLMSQLFCFRQKTNDVVADTDVVIDTVASAHEGETGAEKPANGRPL